MKLQVILVLLLVISFPISTFAWAEIFSSIIGVSSDFFSSDDFLYSSNDAHHYVTSENFPTSHSHSGENDATSQQQVSSNAYAITSGEIRGIPNTGSIEYFSTGKLLSSDASQPISQLSCLMTLVAFMFM